MTAAALRQPDRTPQSVILVGFKWLQLACGKWMPSEIWNGRPASKASDLSGVTATYTAHSEFPRRMPI